MTMILYSATGCRRCQLVRRFLQAHEIAFQEHDSLAEGRETFGLFYRTSRRRICRGPDGIEFPILTDGEMIRQGLPMVLAHLTAGPCLDGFFRPGTLHGQWVDGVLVSGGDAKHGDEFLAVLGDLKNNRLKLQIDTRGANADLLQQVLDLELADRTVMEIGAPPDKYDLSEIKRTIALVSRCRDHLFSTTIGPLAGETGRSKGPRGITPEEVSQIARLIGEVTGDSTQPYRLQVPDFRTTSNKVPAGNLLVYRNSARKFQFKTEIST